MNSLIKNLPVLVAVSTLLFVSQAQAQDDGLANDIINQVNNNGGGVADAGTTGATGATGGTGGGTDGVGDGLNLDNIFDRQIEITPDERQNTGFVGASQSAERGENASRLQFRFIGLVNENDAATGGANNVTPNRPNQGAANNNSSPRVQRARPVRARLVPRFSAPRVAPAAVSARVNQRLSSLPSTRRLASSMNVSVQGRTAFVNSSGMSQQQMSRVSRQLRLEPGIRRVVSRGR